MNNQLLNKAIELLLKKGIVIDSKNKKNIKLIAKKILFLWGFKYPNTKRSIKYYKTVIINFLESYGVHTKKQSHYISLAQKFYISQEWRSLRYEVLKENGGRCCLCGRSAKDGVVLHVDHIIPLSKDWSKRLDKDNLQVLCEDCNLGKSNKDNLDWR